MTMQVKDDGNMFNRYFSNWFNFYTDIFWRLLNQFFEINVIKVDFFIHKRHKTVGVFIYKRLMSEAKGRKKQFNKAYVGRHTDWKHEKTTFIDIVCQLKM